VKATGTVFLMAWMVWVSSTQGGTVVTVRADRPSGPVNRLLFGANLSSPAGSDGAQAEAGGGLWNADAREPVPECVAAAKACGVSVVRWPGACDAHAWNWKEFVGPRDRRPQQQPFGLPEFLAWCRDTAVVPYLVLGAYWGTERDAADLVEYLNAPNNGANPNGGTDWAAVRAADGHAPVYEVVWFEFDAEAWHGDHAPGRLAPIRQRLSPVEYAERYLRWRDAMRAIDPAIRLGAAVPAEAETWSRPVLEEAGKRLDFAVASLRLPCWESDASPDQSRVLLQAAVAAGAQAAATWDRLNALVEETCGRTDLPWVVTDLGNQYAQEKPVPYRFTLAAALGQAELLNAILEPRHRVAMAMARGFANGDWGMVQGHPLRREPLRRQAMAMVYELYAQHFGDTRVEAAVVGDTWDFPGGAAVLPRSGSPHLEMAERSELMDGATAWSVESVPGLLQRGTGAMLTVEFPGKDIDYRYASIALRAKPDTWYRIRGMVRTEDLTGTTGVRFEVGDGRKGAAAKPTVLSSEVLGTSEWTDVVVDYRTPSEAETLVVTARRSGHGGGPDAVSGRARFRLYSVREIVPPNYGAVPDVDAQAARRSDGTLAVLLVNRNLEREQSVGLAIAGMALRETSQARMWLLQGPWPWATNNGREELVRLWMPRPERSANGWTAVLPAHSMAAIEITP